MKSGQIECNFKVYFIFFFIFVLSVNRWCHSLDLHHEHTSLCGPSVLGSCFADSHTHDHSVNFIAGIFNDFKHKPD